MSTRLSWRPKSSKPDVQYCATCKATPWTDLPRLFIEPTLLPPGSGEITKVKRLVAIEHDQEDSVLISTRFHKDYAALTASSHHCPTCAFIVEQSEPALDNIRQYQRQFPSRKAFISSDGTKSLGQLYVGRLQTGEEDFAERGMRVGVLSVVTEYAGVYYYIVAEFGVCRQTAKWRYEDEEGATLWGLPFAKSSFHYRSRYGEVLDGALIKVEEWFEQCQSQKAEHIAVMGTSADRGPVGYFSAKNLRLPARLLQIDLKNAWDSFDTFNGVRLIEVDDTHEMPWAALSHCWGKGQPLVTTTATLAQHREGIPMSSLPQTFKDAIEVVRNLHMRYIWIDSLCIIQDDVDDWNRESEKMWYTYSNASVVIAAVHAKDATEGLFSPPMIEPSKWQSAPSPFVQRTKNRVWFYGVSKAYGQDALEATNMDNEPLMQRGWAFQERFLSRRILYFSQGQVQFECEHLFCNELSQGRSIWGARPMDRKKRWSRMVSEYSERRLKYATDRLVAISGIAKAFHMGNTAADYLAGLWSVELIHDLAWSSRAASHSTQQGGGDERGDEYIAPSWSWASHNGPIEYLYYRGQQVRAKYVDHSISLASSNIFGAVTDGWLALEGPLFELDRADPPIEAILDEEPALAWEEILLVLGARKTFYFILGTHKTTMQNVDHYHGLIITKSGSQSDHMRRIGSVALDSSKYFMRARDKNDWRTVKLV